MLEAAAILAETKAAALRQSALNEMNRLLGREVERLQTLAQVNDHVRPQEVRLAETQQEELVTILRQSRLRLDSLRLIWKGPPEALS
jgi:ATP-dependent helicase HepA